MALCLPLLSAGCSQEEGERCEVDKDCAEGLVCTLTTQTSTQNNRVCRPRGAVVPTPTVDAGSQVLDASAEVTTAVDAQSETRAEAAPAETTEVSPPAVDVRAETLDGAVDSRPSDTPSGG